MEALFWTRPGFSSQRLRCTSPEEFSRILRRDIDKWALVVNESGAKVD